MESSIVIACDFVLNIILSVVDISVVQIWTTNKSPDQLTTVVLRLVEIIPVALNAVVGVTGPFCKMKILVDIIIDLHLVYTMCTVYLKAANRRRAKR